MDTVELKAGRTCKGEMTPKKQKDIQKNNEEIEYDRKREIQNPDTKPMRRRNECARPTGKRQTFYTNYPSHNTMHPFHNSIMMLNVGPTETKINSF